jgi:hypothetical protein
MRVGEEFAIKVGTVETSVFDPVPRSRYGRRIVDSFLDVLSLV